MEQEITIDIDCKIAKWWFVVLKITTYVIRAERWLIETQIIIAKKLAYKAIKVRIGKEKKWRLLRE